MLRQLKLLFKTPDYALKYFYINNVRHKLICDVNLFDRETTKLLQILNEYYATEEQIFKVSNIALSDFFARKLMYLSPVSICDNLTYFENLLEITELDYSVKRWQDLIVSIYTFIDPEVIDAYTGRYFKQMFDHHWSPNIPSMSPSAELLINIRTQHLNYPWSWILIPFQQQNNGKLMNLESQYSNKIK